MRDETRIRQRLDARGDQVSFGRVQIAAAGVNPERPSGESRGLPGGEREGVVEQPRDGGLGDGFRGRERTEQGGVRRGVETGRRIAGGEVEEREEREERGGGVAAKWVGLVRPVEAAGASGVAGEGVLGPVVVREDQREALSVEDGVALEVGRRR